MLGVGGAEAIGGTEAVGGLDLAGILTNVAGGGVGGGVLMAVVGLVKKLVSK